MSADHDQRTLEPTPRRVEEFRKRGEIARSRDLSQVASMAGGAIVGAWFSESSISGVTNLMRRTCEGLGSTRWPDGLAATLVGACVPVMTGAALGYLLSAAVQLGWPPVLSRPKLDLSRLFSPGSLVQMLSPKAMVGRTLKSTAKILVCAVVAGAVLADECRLLLVAPALEPGPLAARLGAATMRLALNTGGALVLLAAIDYWYQRRTMAAKMRMTRDEMKREARQQEGDPHIKGQRRRRMREMSKRRLATAVKTADTVLVNPTEYAVALRYRSGKDRAPCVVAKGRGTVAERIRELARKAGIPILVEPPLCRMLHKLVPEGREIPAQLYHSVAEVLAYVYRLRGRPV